MEKEKDLVASERGNGETEIKSTVEYLFQEIAELVVNNFVATYTKEDTKLFMRLPSGKTFKIIVQEA